MTSPDSSEELAIKKVAFVAMPYGKRPTGIRSGKGPPHIDFDALYERAIEPALSEHFLPIRADNQTGSVIVKDMLEQLVHADLVLCDVSIPNGNVYYEAGVRHAARKTGCLLMCAEWSALLFDLAQLRQLRYPFPSSEPSQADYDTITAVLKKAISEHGEAVGPVYELTHLDDSGAPDSRVLKEAFRGVFEFQSKLAGARVSASHGQKESLRALVQHPSVAHLPSYALRELTVAVRNWLTWGELVSLMESLPESARSDPFFKEQQAHALTCQGRPGDAVGLLNALIESHGPTPERYRTLGDRFCDLMQESRNKQAQRVQQSSAIEAFRKGMTLDLNAFRCARSLLVALVNRNRSKDKLEAQDCAVSIRHALARAQELDPDAEEVHETRAVLAFFEQQLDAARREVELLLDRGSTGQSRVRLVEDLRTMTRAIDESTRASFERLIADLLQSLPLSQEHLKEHVLPRITQAARRYEKFEQVHARPARVGEVIVSMTGDGDETTNVAKVNEFVVKNLTQAGEQYIVSGATFERRYTAVRDLEDGWKLYDPVGEVLALEISRDLSTDLDVGEEFFIEAPWGSEQIAKEGDLLVSPLPDLNEVYRIARTEFYETYRLAPAE